MFAFVPPWRYPKSFVPGDTWLPPVLFHVLVAPGGAGEYV
jgi:hypothetical protein